LVKQGWTGCEKSWPSFEGRCVRHFIGDGEMGAMPFLGESSESLSKSSGGFGIYRLDHEYELFGDVGREISA